MAGDVRALLNQRRITYLQVSKEAHVGVTPRSWARRNSGGIAAAILAAFSNHSVQVVEQKELAEVEASRRITPNTFRLLQYWDHPPSLWLRRSLRSLRCSGTPRGSKEVQEAKLLFVRLLRSEMISLCMTGIDRKPGISFSGPAPRHRPWIYGYDAVQEVQEAVQANQKPFSPRPQQKPRLSSWP